MRRTIAWLKRALLGLLILAAAAYVLDALSVRFRFPGNRDPYGSVHVQPLLAVPQKNGRMEYILGDAEDEKCVKSLFPHSGLSPCWYLNRHKQKRIDM